MFKLFNVAVNTRPSPSSNLKMTSLIDKLVFATTLLTRLAIQPSSDGRSVGCGSGRPEEELDVASVVLDDVVFDDDASAVLCNSSSVFNFKTIMTVSTLTEMGWPVKLVQGTLT